MLKYLYIGALLYLGSWKISSSWLVQTTNTASQEVEFFCTKAGVRQKDMNVVSLFRILVYPDSVIKRASWYERKEGTQASTMEVLSKNKLSWKQGPRETVLVVEERV